MQNPTQFDLPFARRVCLCAHHPESPERPGGTVEGAWPGAVEHRFETFTCEDCRGFSIAHCEEALDPTYADRFDGVYGLGATRCLRCWKAWEYRQRHGGGQ